MIQINKEAFAFLQGTMPDMDFAETIGIDRTMYWRLKTGRSSVGHEFIEKFLLCFPMVAFEDYFIIPGREKRLEELSDPKGVFLRARERPGGGYYGKGI